MTQLINDLEAPETLFLTGAVSRWREELRELDVRRGVLVKKLDHAEHLLELVKIEPVTSKANVIPSVEATTDVDETTVVWKSPNSLFEIRSNASWVDLVKAWVSLAPLGITYAELRGYIEADAVLASRFSSSEKGYYHAISRVVGRGEVIRYNGRLFTPDAYDRFKVAVGKGEIEDEKPVSFSAHSPMGEAILDIVLSHKDRGGISGKEIIQRLRQDPEFNATLTPHSSGAYNVIARLIKRYQIVRRDDGICLPGTKFPKRDKASKWLVGGPNPKGQLSKRVRP